MTSDKKSLLLIIAEPRTTYDFTFAIDKQVDYTIELSHKIAETKKLLGIDTAILASATPVSVDNDFSDWHWGHVEGSWWNQSFIEMGHLDEKGNLILEHEDCYMGKCFYPEGFAIMSKEKGFGNYEMIKTMQPGTIAEKTTEYIKELSKTYNIEKVILLNDFGYNEPIVDEERLEKEYGIFVDTFIPTKPYCSQSSGVSERENYIKVWSSEVSIEGIIDCFSQYNKTIDDNKKKRLKI